VIDIGKAEILTTLDELDRKSPPPELGQVHAPLRRNFATLERIYAIGASGAGYGARADRLAGDSAASKGVVTDLLSDASDQYDARATSAATRATVGAAGVILLLLGAFGFFFVRFVRASAENERLLIASRHEALSDALTGLANRRALIRDLEEQVRGSSSRSQLVLGLFDLDGFKYYNDTFGHPAGDVLLARLGKRLSTAMEGLGGAYRMGGDEFCILVKSSTEAAHMCVTLAASALSEVGEAFEIGCSYGVARVPVEASTGEEALGVADQRMYAEKAGRSSASRQSIDVLLRVLEERVAGLGDHLSSVAALAEPTAERLGLLRPEVKRIHVAAELHDIGKSAIPDAILKKPGPLDDEEWEFMHRHTLIGERILLSAPSLASAAELVRSSHERVDGQGYPDGLMRDEIPLGSRVIAVCDAFDAMTSNRPYRQAMSVSNALTELRGCAGTQFDPEVVRVFSRLVEERVQTDLEAGDLVLGTPQAPLPGHSTS
jgi:diguanylate cyclase (GGDEF)-like protein